MTAPTCTLTLNVADISGGNVSGATVTATLSHPDVYQGMVAVSDVSAETDSSGNVSLVLFRSALGELGSHYAISASKAGESLGTLYVRLPSASTATLAACEVSRKPFRYVAGTQEDVIGRVLSVNGVLPDAAGNVEVAGGGGGGGDVMTVDGQEPDVAGNVQVLGTAQTVAEALAELEAIATAPGAALTYAIELLDDAERAQVRDDTSLPTINVTEKLQSWLDAAYLLYGTGTPRKGGQGARMLFHPGQYLIHGLQVRPGMSLVGLASRYEVRLLQSATARQPMIDVLGRTSAPEDTQRRTDVFLQDLFIKCNGLAALDTTPIHGIWLRPEDLETDEANRTGVIAHRVQCVGASGTGFHSEKRGRNWLHECQFTGNGQKGIFIQGPDCLLVKCYCGENGQQQIHIKSSATPMIDHLELGGGLNPQTYPALYVENCTDFVIQGGNCTGWVQVDGGEGDPTSYDHGLHIRGLLANVVFTFKAKSFTDPSDVYHDLNGYIWVKNSRGLAVRNCMFRPAEVRLTDGGTGAVSYRYQYRPLNVLYVQGAESFVSFDCPLPALTDPLWPAGTPAQWPGSQPTNTYDSITNKPAQVLLQFTDPTADATSWVVNRLAVLDELGSALRRVTRAHINAVPLLTSNPTLAINDLGFKKSSDTLLNLRMRGSDNTVRGITLPMDSAFSRPVQPTPTVVDPMHWPYSASPLDADATTAIQTAINDLSTAGGGDIVLHQLFNVNSLTVPGNVNIKGSRGPACGLVQITTAVGPVIAATPKQGRTTLRERQYFTGFRIDGSSAGVVVTTGLTTAGSNVLGSVGLVTGVADGWLVEGAGIPDWTTVTSVAARTMSANATYANVAGDINRSQIIFRRAVTLSATATADSATLTLADTSAIAVGMRCRGANLEEDGDDLNQWTRVLAKTSTTVTLDRPATSSGAFSCLFYVSNDGILIVEAAQAVGYDPAKDYEAVTVENCWIEKTSGKGIVGRPKRHQIHIRFSKVEYARDIGISMTGLNDCYLLRASAGSCARQALRIAGGATPRISGEFYLSYRDDIICEVEFRSVRELRVLDIDLNGRIEVYGKRVSGSTDRGQIHDLMGVNAKWFDANRLLPGSTTPDALLISNGGIVRWGFGGFRPDQGSGLKSGYAVSTSNNGLVLLSGVTMSTDTASAHCPFSIALATPGSVVRGEYLDVDTGTVQRLLSVPYVTMTNGGSATVSGDRSETHFEAASTIGSYTVSIPAGVDNEERVLVFHRGVTVITLTGALNAADTWPTEILSGTTRIAMRWRASNSTWYRIA